MKINTHLTILSLSAILFSGTASAQIINTIGGNGLGGYSGDGTPATVSTLNGPTGVTIDTAGNLYVADRSNNRIRKITSAGIVSTYAGNGTAGNSGDGAAATAAMLNNPYGVAIDNHNNLYISGYLDNSIRKVSSTGIITTVAGNGTGGYSGDGGPATAAQLFYPLGCIVDTGGNIYIADYLNHRIRKVNSSGIISTIAGTGAAGYSGDNGPGTAAQLAFPQSITVDKFGNLYIADEDNNRIRKLTPSGTITTVAGDGTMGYSGNGGAATAAQIYHPTGVYINNNGYIYIADYGNSCIREVTPAGIINTIAGIGTTGYSGDGGPAIAAALSNPTGLITTADSLLYIADWGNNRVRKMGICNIPNVDTITGPDSVCIGDTVHLNTSTTGGSWSSLNTALATVTSSGSVIGISSGIDTIRYIVSSPCGSDTASFLIYIRPNSLCNTSVSKELLSDQVLLKISPNPNNGLFVLNIFSKITEPVEIKITDIFGRIISKTTATTNKNIEMDTNIPKGIYFIFTNNRFSQSAIKFIVD